MPREPLALRLLRARCYLPAEIEIVPCGDVMHFRLDGKLYLTRVGHSPETYRQAIRTYTNAEHPASRYATQCRTCKQLIIGGGIK